MYNSSRRKTEGVIKYAVSKDNNKGIKNHHRSSQAEESNSEPSEVQLVLLCLDYLRSLRRSRCAAHDDLDIELGINQDYITVAIWALSNSFSKKEELSHGNVKDAYKCMESPLQYGNDPFFHPKKEHFAHVDPLTLKKRGFDIGNNVVIPQIEIMEIESLYKVDPSTSSRKKKNQQRENMSDEFEDDFNDATSLNLHQAAWYKYDDDHYSNHHRFYKTMGLSSKAPLTLQEIAATGISTLNAKSRKEAEEGFMNDPLFQDFVDAVTRNGYFKISEKDVLEHPDATMNMSDDKIVEITDKIHEERFRKVVSKFRTKLATHHGEEEEEEEYKEDEEEEGEIEEREDISNKVEWERKQYKISNVKKKVESKAKLTKNEPTRTEKAKPVITQLPFNEVTSQQTFHKKESTLTYENDDEMDYEHICEEDDVTLVASSVYADVASKGSKNDSDLDNNIRRPPSRISLASVVDKSGIAKTDLENAERLKGFGNIAMQKKNYEKAKYYYTRALELIPAGPTSHVYFSNRAAALLSMRKFNEAVWDAQRSIALEPNYAKAHARLGLAHFLLENYQEAVAAYSLAVKYDPSNATSALYLEKSKKKLLMSTPDQRESLRSATDSKSRGRSATRVQKDPLEERFNNAEDSPELNTSPTKKMNTLRNRIDAAAKRMSPERFINSAMNDEELVQKTDPPIYNASSDDSGKVSNEEQEAHRLKSEGNKAMARKQYDDAVMYYSRALRLSPAGAQSHVYFSNRAAALCYLERYEEAELDAERSLALCPEYSKAHARLGLSRYFLKDYYGAVEAYESALQYDPSNEASKSYLAKARAKVTARRNSSRGIEME